MDAQDLPSEYYKLFLIVVYLIVAAFSNWFTLAIIHDFVGRVPLNDVVFNIIEEKPWAVHLGDAMVALSTLCLILLFIFHNSRLIIVRRVLFIISVLYTLRTIFMAVTQLPASYTDNEYRCRKQLNASERTFDVYVSRTLEQAIHVGFQDNGNKMLCGDLLFSGHTLMMVVGMLAVDYYVPEKFNLLKYFPRLFAYVGMFSMIISRTHYTCDVILAYFIVLCIFTLYHAYCEIDGMDRKDSILHGVYLLGKVISWLEKDTPSGQIKNELQMPQFANGISQLWSNPDKRRRNDIEQARRSADDKSVQPL